MSSQVQDLYEFGPFRIDSRERLLSCHGKPVAVTPKAFDTLLVLVQNSGHLLLKEELLKAIWPDSFVEEVNLSQSISTLRRALGDTAHKSRYIATVPGKGYRFVADVRPVLPSEDGQASPILALSGHDRRNCSSCRAHCLRRLLLWQSQSRQNSCCFRSTADFLDRGPAAGESLQRSGVGV